MDFCCEREVTCLGWVVMGADFEGPAELGGADLDLLAGVDWGCLADSVDVWGLAGLAGVLRIAVDGEGMEPDTGLVGV